MFAIEIQRRFLNQLAAGLHLQPRGLSPIPRIDTDLPLPSTAASPPPPNDTGIPDSMLQRIVTILWKAERSLRLRHGGNWNAPEQRQFFSLTSDPSLLVAITPTTRETAILQVLESPAEFGSWLANTLNPSGLVHARPGPASRALTPDELLHVLHLADMFRRVHHQSQLDYLPLEVPRFSLGDYTTALTSALFSQDYRSLLPCLLTLTPSSFPRTTEDLRRSFDVLTEFGLLIEEPGAAFTFTDEGAAWGAEIMTTWLASAGLECSVAGADGTHTLPVSLFITACAASLHTFVIDRSHAPGSITWTIPDVASLTHLVERFVHDGEAAAQQARHDSEALAARKKTHRAPAAAASFCAKCGSPIIAGAKFCAKCGSPILAAAPPTSPSCPACGQTIHPGEKFCGHCGHRLT